MRTRWIMINESSDYDEVESLLSKAMGVSRSNYIKDDIRKLLEKIKKCKETESKIKEMKEQCEGAV